ncbi:STAS domain-containing protein [Aneurinibacillus sp. BA2021]|nr:STAS domain-containing protein [Aneurinibacillus sp. BA2021]
MKGAGILSLNSGDSTIKKDLIHEVAVYLKKNNEGLGQEILTKVITRMDLDLHGKDEQIHGESFSRLIEQIGNSLLSTENQPVTNHRGYDKGNYFYQRGVALKNTIAILSEFRLLLFDVVDEFIANIDISKEDIVFIYRRITQIFDNTLKSTTDQFSKLRDDILKESMNALAAPIVPIQQGKAVLPLIGHIDTHRANHIMNTVIPKVADMKINCLIIDFSGIQVIDSFVTSHLFKITATLRLLGIKAMITGIRPVLAETAVRIGIDLSGIETFATVQQALESIDKEKLVER